MPKNKPREVFVIDCETDPFLYGREPKPFIWGCYSEKSGFHYFDTAESLLETLYDKHAVVFAHNGGRFDFLFLQDYFIPWSSVRLINGRVASFKLNDCIFRDSFLILPTALRNYKKDKIDYSIMEKSERSKPENFKKILSYLEADCRYLHELVMGFVNPTERVLPWLPLRSPIFAKWGLGQKSQKRRVYITKDSKNSIKGVGFHAFKPAYSTANSR